MTVFVGWLSNDAYQSYESVRFENHYEKKTIKVVLDTGSPWTEKTTPSNMPIIYTCKAT